MVTSNCATTRNHVVPGRLCYEREFVTVDSFDGPRLKELTRVAAMFWNLHADTTILSIEYLPVTVKEPKWITVSAATVDQLADWRSSKRATSIIQYSGECISGTTILINNSDGPTDNIILLALIHEIGHAIGIDHSEYKYSVMYPTRYKETKIKLGPDSIKELRKLYGEP